MTGGGRRMLPTSLGQVSILSLRSRHASTLPDAAFLSKGGLKKVPLFVETFLPAAGTIDKPASPFAAGKQDVAGQLSSPGKGLSRTGAHGSPERRRLRE